MKCIPGIVPGLATALAAAGTFARRHHTRKGSGAGVRAHQPEDIEIQSAQELEAPLNPWVLIGDTWPELSLCMTILRPSR